VKAPLFLVIGAVAALLVTFVTMSLWNALMPGLFGLKVLSFWQALGLLVLSWLFFGRFRGFGHHHRMKHRLAERWMRMSPEERDKFRQQMHEHCGDHHHHHHGGPPTSGDAA
jgi:uncharacterized membrane protein YdjX (TVP38/TMEM64 family)